MIDEDDLWKSLMKKNVTDKVKFYCGCLKRDAWGFFFRGVTVPRDVMLSTDINDILRFFDQVKTDEMQYKI